MAISSMLVELERGAMHDVPQNDEPPNDEPQEAKISPAVLRVRRASKNEMEPLEQNEAVPAARQTRKWKPSLLA